MKNVKKLLRDQAHDILPDDTIKDNIRREFEAEQAERELALVNGESKAVSPSKHKKLLAVAAVLLVAALAVGLLFPLLHGRFKRPFSDNLGKFSGIENTQDFYVYGAASVGSLLSTQAVSEEPIAKAMSFSATKTFTTLPETPALLAALTPQQQAIADTLDEYMALVENLLGDGAIEHHDEELSDGPYAQTYRYHTTVSYADISGTPVVYNLYYNSTLTDSETDGDEQEDSFSIDGILVIGEQTYSVKGEHEQESETDETESKLTFTAYMNEEKTSRICLEHKQESETNETESEFRYSFYENGTFVKSTSVQYEQEEGELELNLLIEENGARDTLSFKRESEQDALEAHGTLRGQPVHCMIRISENGSQKYEYFFTVGSDNEDDDDFDDDSDNEDDNDDDD